MSWPSYGSRWESVVHSRVGRRANCAVRNGLGRHYFPRPCRCRNSQFATRIALLRVPPRDLLQPALDLVGRQPPAAHHDTRASLEVVQVRERVGVEEHEIGALADGDAAEARI